MPSVASRTGVEIVTYSKLLSEVSYENVFGEHSWIICTWLERGHDYRIMSFTWWGLKDKVNRVLLQFYSKKVLSCMIRHVDFPSFLVLIGDFWVFFIFGSNALFAYKICYLKYLSLSAIVITKSSLCSFLLLNGTLFVNDSAKCLQLSDRARSIKSEISKPTHHHYPTFITILWAC